jgi:glycosyltransferase involved in cell wall biosynthesis
LRSAIKDGETGILAADDASFIRALAFLLEDDEARARYAEAAVQWASRFSWEACAQATLDVLRGSEPAAHAPEAEFRAA